MSWKDIRHDKYLVTVIAAIMVAAVSFVFITAVSVHAASRVPTSPKYVALGDSIAAGAGLPSTTTLDDQLCGRSLQSYPNLLAAKLNTSVTNLSCGGATVGKGITGSQTVGRNGQSYVEPAQLDRAFQGGKPDVITLTVGANDMAWTYYISKCYTGTCGDKKDSTAIGLYLTYFQGKLANTLRDIKKESGNQTPPKVIVTGYYNPISSTSCLNGTVTAQELAWINYETYNLNKAISQTVAATTKVSSWFRGTYNFATFVPVNFDGHGVCSATPWVQGLGDPAPIHPNATGQAKIADALYPYASR